MNQDDRNKAREAYARDVDPGSGMPRKVLEKRDLEFHRRMIERAALDTVRAVKEIATSTQAGARDGLHFFTLAKDGTLARRSPLQGDKPYSMEEGSRRHKAMKALASSKNDSYIPTRDLAETIGCAEDQLRRTYGEVKRQISKHFTGVKFRDVIDSKVRSGYRINPKARIIEIP